jgi:DNA repair protein RadB
MTKIPTGSEVFDELLEGGYETDIVTTVFGPAGSGKTNLCIVSAVETVKQGKKVIYIDSEGGFSVERIKQLTPDYKETLDNIFFLKPITFDEQKASFEQLKNLVNDKIGLIVIDSIVMLYRLEIAKTDDVYNLNRQLGQQLGFLTEIARRQNVPVLVTNQVYADFDNKEKVNMVGGDILKYGSKCIIELQKGHKSLRKAILRKHRHLAEGNEALFIIENEGLKKQD